MAYKRLIEHRLPLAEVSTESAREKSIRHGHISTLHIWWARRPLAASRAAVFATLVPDTDENYELVKKIVPWEAVKDGNNEHILEARRRVLEANGGVPPKVLDPFGGGGAIPLEALRLGCEVYSLDLNPVAHIIQKATLEFPQKYGQPNSRPVPEYIREKDRQAQANAKGKVSKANKGKANQQVGFDFGSDDGEWGRAYKQNPLATDVRYWGEWVLEKARAELVEFYPPDEDGKVPVAYLWARTVTCTNPACRILIPTVTNWWVARRTKKNLAIRVEYQDRQPKFDVVEVEANETWPEKGTMQRDNTNCPVCGTSIDGKQLRSIGKKGGIGSILMAVAVVNPASTGREYRSVTQADLSALDKASNKLPDLEAIRLSGDIPIIPQEDIIEWSGVFNAPLYGLSSWRSIFTDRQLSTMATFTMKNMEFFEHSRNIGLDEDYAKALSVYMALNIDRIAMRNSNLCIYDNTTEAIMQIFNQGQSMPMRWSYAEANPTGGSSGDWMTSLDYLIKTIEVNSKSSKIPAKVLRGSATNVALPDKFIDAIVTDPPYYDAVPYSDLSDFFYVWLRRNLNQVYPEHFRTPLTPKSQEATQNIVRHNGNKISAKKDFENKMSQAFLEMNRMLTDRGEATIVFAHKSTDAWETLIESLIKAGFKVDSSWPVSTESKNRLRAKDSAALASSTFIKCTKRADSSVGYFNDVRRDMIAAIQPQLAEFWESGIRGADFFMSAIGPGLESYSSHDEVRRVSGEVVTVGEFLDEVRKIVMEFALGQVLGTKSLGTVDAPTQFALLSLWGYGAVLPSDEARKLAQSVGIELDEIEGLVKVKGDKATVQTLKERAKDKHLGLSRHGEKVPMVDAMYKAVNLLAGGSRQTVADYLGTVGYLQEEAFWQTMQALAEVQEGVDDGRALHELLTIRDNLPKPSASAAETLFGGRA